MLYMTLHIPLVLHFVVGPTIHAGAVIIDPGVIDDLQKVTLQYKMLFSELRFLTFVFLLRHVFDIVHVRPFS